MTLDYAVPYQWSNTATGETNKWGPPLWDICIQKYFYAKTDDQIEAIIAQKPTGTGANNANANAQYLKEAIKIISSTGGKNYFSILETACNKPLFLHPGIDYGTTGQIVAMAPGKVLKVINANKTKAGFLGKAVFIEHELICTSEKVRRTIKFYAAYYHLDKIKVKENQGVFANTPIAETTYTWPNITGGNRHLHLEVHTKESGGKLFDTWPSNSDVTTNIMALIDVPINVNTTFTNFKNAVNSSFIEKQNNKGLFSEIFKGTTVKKTANGKVNIKGTKLNSDSFAKNLSILANLEFNETITALSLIPEYAPIYADNKKGNYTQDKEAPTMPKGYIDPRAIKDTIDKALLPPEK